MPCTLSRTQSDISGISERRKASLALKPLEQNTVVTPEDLTESPLPVVWQDIQSRCAFLTFLTLETNGNWKILAVPVICSENTNHLTRRSQCSGRSSSGSHVISQPPNRAIQDSDFLPDINNKSDSTVKKCMSKKSRKKGKRGKKSPLDGFSAGILPSPSLQCDFQENLNGARDVPEDTAASSDQNVPKRCLITGPENHLRTNEPEFLDDPSSNSSISSDGQESLKVDSSASDIEGGEVRCHESVNSNPSRKLLNDAVDFTDPRDKTSQGDGKNTSKKSSHVKTVVNSPSFCRSGILGSSRSFNTGSETSHPVWQKVQRKGGRGSNSMKVKHKLVETNEAPKDEDKKQASAKESGKVKRKHGSSFKQESNRYSKKGSPSNKSKSGSSNKSSHTNVISISHGDTPSDIPRDKSRNDDSECLNTESVEDSHACCEGLPLCGVNGSSTANSDCERMEDMDSSSGETRFGKNIMSPLVYPHILAAGVAHSGKEDVPSESCGQKTSGSVMQKWVPVGTRTIASTGLSESCVSIEHCQTETCQEQNPSVNFENGISLSVSEVENSCSPSEEEQTASTSSQKSVVSEDKNDFVASISSNISGLKGQCQSNLGRIARAIDNAHRAQLESEAFHMATGAPVAEFERLLHFSSPVLCLSYSLTSRVCPKNHLDSSLCLHETPGIPLGCLWQWYQKHGSFGLEIRGKDYNNSKRLGMDRFSFRAYFVPYLSAVQLFRATSSSGDPYHNPGTCEKSPIDQLPTFPMQVPGACEESVTSQSDESASCKEPELVFEYFELEQPQQRRPLHEKIQELVKREGPLWDKAYGDPASLISLNIQDLDPQSWYSVAWYPIYRIPDGNFRAAFLTYHSLGHFVCRNSSDNCVVSPAVGMQSYSAQSECWFKLGPSVTSHTVQPLSLDPSKILRERLGTLEEAASLMSRATVRKGDGHPTLNYHPDFEFFLSRRRYS